MKESAMTDPYSQPNPQDQYAGQNQPYQDQGQEYTGQQQYQGQPAQPAQVQQPQGQPVQGQYQNPSQSGAQQQGQSYQPYQQPQGNPTGQFSAQGGSFTANQKPTNGFMAFVGKMEGVSVAMGNKTLTLSDLLTYIFSILGVVFCFLPFASVHFGGLSESVNYVSDGRDGIFIIILMVVACVLTFLRKFMYAPILFGISLILEIIDLARLNSAYLSPGVGGILLLIVLIVLVSLSLVRTFYYKDKKPVTAPNGPQNQPQQYTASQPVQGPYAGGPQPQQYQNPQYQAQPAQPQQYQTGQTYQPQGQEQPQQYQGQQDQPQPYPYQSNQDQNQNSQNGYNPSQQNW